MAHRLEGAVSSSTFLTFPRSVLYTKTETPYKAIFCSYNVTSHNTHQYIHFFWGNETSQGASNETGDFCGFLQKVTPIGLHDFHWFPQCSRRLPTNIPIQNFNKSNNQKASQNRHGVRAKHPQTSSNILRGWMPPIFGIDLSVILAFVVIQAWSVCPRGGLSP